MVPNKGVKVYVDGNGRYEEFEENPFLNSRFWSHHDCLPLHTESEHELLNIDGSLGLLVGHSASLLGIGGGKCLRMKMD